MERGKRRSLAASGSPAVAGDEEEQVTSWSRADDGVMAMVGRGEVRESSTAVMTVTTSW
jgi:hypothetical protein